MPKKDTFIHVRASEDLVDQLKKEADKVHLAYSSHVRQKLSKPVKE